MAGRVTALWLSLAVVAMSGVYAVVAAGSALEACSR